MEKDAVSGKTNFPLAELSLGAEFSECSIAAAELNKRVAEVFAGSQPETKFLHEVVNGEVYGRYQQVVYVTPSTKTDKNQEIQFALTRDFEHSGSTQSEQTRLAVLYRNDISLPIASFTRRPGMFHCDYVQFGQQMFDDIMVTPDDESKRFEKIELIRELLAGDQIFLPGLDQSIVAFVSEYVGKIDESQVSKEIKKFNKKSEIRIQSTAEKQGTGLAVLAFHSIDRKIFTSSIDGFQFGDLMRFDMPHGNKHKLKGTHARDYNVYSYSQRKRFDRYYEKVEKYLSKASVGELVAAMFTDELELIPGAGLPAGRAMLWRLGMYELAERGLALDPYEDDHSLHKQTVATKVAEAFTVQDELTTLFGESMPEHESLLTSLRLLGAVALETEIETNNGRSKARADVRLTIQNTGTTSHSVRYEVRPDAMEDHDYKTVGIFMFDRAARPLESNHVISEIDKVIKAATSH